MKKAGIIAGMVIWSLVAVRYICEANEKKSDIFTAFATSNCNYVTGKVIGGRIQHIRKYSGQGICR